ncbi:helix-turn-helix domain-containing protein [Winogradskyella arenosi]|uniref:Helix-turn-helix protein n=1 Tax=Winogradskyella arenosi TaxID=533325 RepID=A0A368ZCE2_9FLAO|nr:helix-turn-helix transcriptional regulator [Winogradskyella arenosi]RCW89789.1 helix-turn-helix protein [Winogradskyella arenosi]
MSKVNKIDTISFDSYLKKNRTKIDESLVSLRFMKEVDYFLDYNKITQRKLADDIGCTEAYISQLMSGVKKINTSFINKLEKHYEVKVEFKILPKKECNYITSFANTFIQININIDDSFEALNMFSSKNSPIEYYELDTDSYTIETNG